MHSNVPIAIHMSSSKSNNFGAIHPRLKKETMARIFSQNVEFSSRFKKTSVVHAQGDLTVKENVREQSVTDMMIV